MRWYRELMHNTANSIQYDSGWMRQLASHYQWMRTAFPDEQLIVLFDIDGTIVDLRHMVLRLLREYDQKRGTTYFRNLGLSDINVNENQIETLLETVPHLSHDASADVTGWYRKRFWDSDVMLESHRPYAGVMEVMRWFQIQPGTSVGINTARTERLRPETLRSLNSLGSEFKVCFRDDLVYMSPYPSDRSIEYAKCEGIRYFRRKGYRVVAFIDNEPANLEAVADMEDADEVLLLHADTLFESARSRLPRTTVSGDTYDITELASPEELPRHVQFVWHGVNDRDNLSRFLGSDVQWCEAAVRTDPATGSLVLNLDPINEAVPNDLMELAELLDSCYELGRSVKLDIMENDLTLSNLIKEIRSRGRHSPQLWFSANVNVLGEEGFKTLRSEFPDSIVQCPVDFIAPLILAMPDEARIILSTVTDWGVSRVSINWKNLLRRQVLDALESWGYEINIYNIPDLESFLKAALLLPTSLTADFSFDATSKDSKLFLVSESVPSWPAGN